MRNTETFPEVKMNKKNTNGSMPMKNHKKSTKNESRKNAKINRQTIERWLEMEKTGKYRRAMRRETYRTTTIRIETEVMDGVLLNLNDRNSDKPMNVQLRLLRRIVEKRQAQAYHNKNGRTNNRMTTIINISHISRNMERLKRRRQAC